MPIFNSLSALSPRPAPREKCRNSRERTPLQQPYDSPSRRSWSKWVLMCRSRSSSRNFANLAKRLGGPLRVPFATINLGKLVARREVGRIKLEGFFELREGTIVFALPEVNFSQHRARGGKIWVQTDRPFQKLQGFLIVLGRGGGPAENLPQGIEQEIIVRTDRQPLTHNFYSLGSLVLLHQHHAHTVDRASPAVVRVSPRPRNPRGRG